MQGSRALTGAVVLLALGAPGAASAQSIADTDRIRINVDAGVQLSSLTFDTSATKTVYIENAIIDASYKFRHGPVFDGGASVRLAGHVSVGVTVSSAMEKADAAVSAAIPHPFFFRTPRTIAGTAGGQRHDELVTHIQAIYTLHPKAAVDVALSAGPSVFHVTQDVVTDVVFTDTYPYDTPVFTSAGSQRVTASNAVGFNVGADVGVRLSRHAGVGAGVRFSRANASLTVPGSTAAVSIDAGGTHIVGGLRLYF
jgi:hypothetical protein